MLASLSRRRQAVGWVQGKYGERPARALREFQHSATELAFLRDRVERGLDVPDFPARERDLLASIARARAVTQGPGLRET
jgi:hypothetical protein